MLLDDFLNIMKLPNGTLLVSDGMVDWLLGNGFFNAPASTKYHGNYDGGLFDHSCAVMKSLVDLTEKNSLKWNNPRSPYIVGMFHDLCKIDQYRGTRCKDGVVYDHIVAWDYNTETLIKGHDDKSVMLLSLSVLYTHGGGNSLYSLPHGSVHGERGMARLHPCNSHLPECALDTSCRHDCVPYSWSVKMAIFKKSNGHIFGVQFSVKEQKAIDAEILRQCAEYDRKNINEVDACILWLLHEKFGFGYKRLKLFHDLFCKELDALVERYEMESGDAVWLATHKLKEYGVDINEWNKEEKS